MNTIESVNNEIKEKFSVIFNKSINEYSQLEISIECPLNDGVGVTFKCIDKDKRIPVKPVYMAKDNYYFIKEYQKNNPNHQFNHILIMAENSQIVDIKFSFDEILHQRTLSKT